MTLITTSFILGISASLGCMSICLPVLVPYIGCNVTTLKTGFITTTIFSLGRLIIYIGLSLLIFTFGSLWVEGKDIIFSRTMQILLAVSIILYGISVSYKYPKFPRCLFKNVHSTSLFTLILGSLIGGVLCPALWLVILQSIRTNNLILILLSITSFWVGSSLLVIFTGSSVGKIGESWKLAKEERFRKTCGFTLVLVGLVYLFGRK